MSEERQNEEEILDNTEAQEAETLKERPKEPEVINYEEKYMRLLAELENTRKRMQKEKQECVRFSIDNAISEFIPVMDNFENALKFAENTSKEVQTWASGFQMILTQFKDILLNHGIVAFHSEGNQFDPHLHEAVEVEETDDHPEGMIIKEFARGYKSQHRTIRPAKVKVCKKPVSSKEPEEKDTEDQEEKANN
jgi:molecular chaperone GrpE